MKVSKYTSIVNLEDKHTLIYGAVSGKFFVIKNKVVRDFQGILNLVDTDTSLYDRLSKAQVLIDENENETEQLKIKIDNAVNDDSIYRLHINPTLDCNFKCWYCYENHHCGTLMSEQTIEQVISYIGKTLERIPKLKEFHIGFFGGEPLLGFDEVVKLLIERAQQLCEVRDVVLSLQFTSNGYLLNDEIISFLAKYPVSFQITLDGDKEQHDKTRFSKGGIGSFDKIIENILSLVRNKIYVIIRINYTTQNAEHLNNILQYFEDCPLEERNLFVFDFHRVWQQKERKDDRTDELVGDIKHLFKDKGFNVSAFNHSDAAHACYADKTNYVLINYNGEAFGCTARDFVSENRIGMLQPDGTILYDEPVYSERAKAKFKNSVCHECRIAPICGGGCRQRAYESLGAGNRCVYNYDEEDKDAKILDIFYQSFC
ncbi:MAG: radical SAM protein [Muribaculaceae bacterium]|nr:radical SAM protein [Muribaculaceae bacterium]